MNKKGLLSNIIGGFITVFIAITLFGSISQEIDNIVNCNITNSTNITYEQPLGSTDSFGGGGAGHFGGYDGTVKKSFTSNFAPYKTNESILNPNCNQLTSSSKTMLEIVPTFFLIAILVVSIGSVYYGLRNSGLIGGDL